MTVTKQQQLEWLAKNHNFTNKHVKYVAMSASEIGLIIGSGTSCNAGLSINCHVITCQEWQQERDKMSKMPDVAISNQTSATISATQVGGSEMTITAQDNSWHERGELPHVGCECNYVTGISCVQVKIQGVGHVDGYPVAFFVMKDSWCTATAEFFRPLRTEREKAIDEMVYEFINHYGDPKGGERYLPIAAKLYDSGYRKVKP